jgi:hypothetical protein
MSRAPRWAVVAAVAVAALAVPAWLSRDTTGAAFSSVTDNVSSFSAAASFAPCTAYTPNWLTGMEHGMDTTAGGGVWSASVTGGTATVDTTVKRSGARSLRLAPAAATAYRGKLYNGFGFTTIVTRFAIRLETLPAANVTELAGMTTVASSAPPYLSVGYVAATNRLSVGFSGQAATAASTTVQAGTWYVVDLKLDVSGATHRADWRVDGVAQTQVTKAAAATSIYQVHWGSSVAATFTANYDDMAVSTTAADYPLGSGRVLALRPDGMGTSVGAANFVDDDGTAVDSTSWTRLADAVMGGDALHVDQSVSSATSYVELTMENTTETCVRAVLGRMVFDPQSTNQADNGKASVFDGTTETVVYSGSMTANNAFMNPKAVPVTAASPPWTPTALNGLVFRIGYSTDVAPRPRWQALMVEYESP